jgi:hypothetical protein
VVGPDQPRTRWRPREDRSHEAGDHEQANECEQEDERTGRDEPEPRPTEPGPPLRDRDDGPEDGVAEISRRLDASIWRDGHADVAGFADAMIAGGRSVTFVRKTMQIAALVGSGAFLLLVQTASSPLT